MVAAQNERLDSFHVKDSMHQAAQDIQGGRILQVCGCAHRQPRSSAVPPARTLTCLRCRLLSL
jgi:hypothetical protein